MIGCNRFQIEHEYVFEETPKGLGYVCVICNSKKQFKKEKRLNDNGQC